jgi:hypothetical protein
MSRDIIDNGYYFDENRKYAEDAEYFNRVIKQYSAVICFEFFTQSITGKYRYGESGLSGNLWEMEKGELLNIFIAYKKLNTNIVICIVACFYSLLKYFRRIFIAICRKYF